MSGYGVMSSTLWRVSAQRAHEMNLRLFTSLTRGTRTVCSIASAGLLKKSVHTPGPRGSKAAVWVGRGQRIRSRLAPSPTVTSYLSCDFVHAHCVPGQLNCEVQSSRRRPSGARTVFVVACCGKAPCRETFQQHLEGCDVWSARAARG